MRRLSLWAERRSAPVVATAAMFVLVMAYSLLGNPVLHLGSSRLLAPDDLSRHVSACDLMLQPYPDGVSSRRTSVMVALAHGRPVVTTSGALSEPLWSGGDVVVAPANRLDELVAATVSLLADPTRLQDLASRARALYAERFDMRHTVAVLRTVRAPARRP